MLCDAGASSGVTTDRSASRFRTIPYANTSVPRMSSVSPGKRAQNTGVGRDRDGLSHSDRPFEPTYSGYCRSDLDAMAESVLLHSEFTDSQSLPLLAVITVPAVGIAVLLKLTIGAFVQRQSGPYLLIVASLAALLGRSTVAGSLSRACSHQQSITFSNTDSSSSRSSFPQFLTLDPPPRRPISTHDTPTRPDSRTYRHAPRRALQRGHPGT